MSEHDIDAGARWTQQLSETLEASRLGVICLTPENQKSPWILFESGALSKSVEESRLIPFLVGMVPSDVEPPLSQFQSVQADRVGTLRLLTSINSLCDTPLESERLERRFHKWWPDLESQIRDAAAQTNPHFPVRSDRDILSEVLALVRSLNKRTALNAVDIAGRLSQKTETVESLIEIDSRPLFDKRGKVKCMPYTPDQSVSLFLDSIYFALNRQSGLPAYMYGQLWLLKNKETGEVYDSIGTQHCKSRGKELDARTLDEIGIKPGDKLLVVPVVAPDGSRIIESLASDLRGSIMDSDINDDPE
jgi:hypothetical protein